MYEDSFSVSAEIISLTTEQVRWQRQKTDWPLRDPHMIDRIQMSRRGTCQVNSIAKCIPTILLSCYSIQLRAYFLSDIFCFLKYNLLIRLACLWWVKSRLLCGLIWTAVEGRQQRTDSWGNAPVALLSTWGIIRKYSKVSNSGWGLYLPPLKGEPGLHLK